MPWERIEKSKTLWLPLSAPGAAWIATALVALVYLLTMCRDLWFFDSAELALVAVQGGLGHPPGHPLHTLLGFLVARLPAVPALIGVNALSALPAALSVIPAISLAESMAGPPSGDEPPLLRQRSLIPATAVVLALHPALWENATRVEVYALACFLSLWAAARLAAGLTVPPERSRGWAPAGVALGLAAAANPVMAAVTAVSAAPALIIGLARKKVAIAAILWVVGGGLLGLIPYLYLPLIGGREDVVVWGGPLRGELLHRYLTGADFQQNLGLTPSIVAGNLVELLGWATMAGLVPILALGLIAHLLWGGEAGLRRAFAPLLLGLISGFMAMNVVFYPEISDYQGYLMPAVWVLAAGTAASLARLAAWRPRGKVLAPVLAAALVVNTVLAPPPLYARTRHRDRVARTLAEGALERAPRDAIIIASSDHWVFPLMYLQEIERVRPDVVVLARGLSGASWHWNRIFRLHPDVARFALRGPGGQPARIRRFLAANPSRPVLYESWWEAEGIGRRGCAGPWLLRDRNACPAALDEEGPYADELTPALEAAIAELGLGAPTTDRVIARVALVRGEDLWRLGRKDEALRALRAGVPPSLRPPLPPGVDLSAAPPLTGPPLRWRDDQPIGHWPRNLLLAGRLLYEAGHERAAEAHVRGW